MPADEAIDLFNYAFEREDDDRLFLRWIPLAQNEMSFDEFKSKLKPAQQKPEKEVLDDVENILNSMIKE